MEAPPTPVHVGTRTMSPGYKSLPNHPILANAELNAKPSSMLSNISPRTEGANPLTTRFHDSYRRSEDLATPDSARVFLDAGTALLQFSSLSTPFHPFIRVLSGSTVYQRACCAPASVRHLHTSIWDLMVSSFTPRMTGFDDIDTNEMVVLGGTGNSGGKKADDDVDDWPLPLRNLG